MQLRMSPGTSMSNARRNFPELPPSSLTVTTAAQFDERVGGGVPLPCGCVTLEPLQQR